MVLGDTVVFRFKFFAKKKSTHSVLSQAVKNIGFTYQKVLHTKGLQTLGLPFLSIHEKTAIKKNTAI